MLLIHNNIALFHTVAIVSTEAKALAGKQNIATIRRQDSVASNQQNPVNRIGRAIAALAVEEDQEPMANPRISSIRGGRGPYPE